MQENSPEGKFLQASAPCGIEKAQKMRRTAITVTVFLAVLSLTACDRKREDYQISPIGYWRGTSSGFQTAILNRKNGSSRFYFKIPGADTANSTIKVEGTYKQANDAFEATYPSTKETVSLECTFMSQDAMCGVMTLDATEPVSIDLER
jgi:hypothetical protein